MPQVGFICPDSEKISFDHCLEQCRMAEPCCPEPYRRQQIIQRKIDHYTVTELLAPTRQMMLRHTVDYYQDPDAGDYALQGSAKHFVLQLREGADELAEERMQLDLGDGYVTSGKADLYDAKDGSLADYKFWKSFRVRKILGLGQPLTADHYDGRDLCYQLNAYRIIWERAGFPVEHMYLWINRPDNSGFTDRAQKPLRDGSPFYTAPLDRRWYRIEVARIPDDVVVGYLAERYRALSEAVASGWAERCSHEETWSGKRCESWCPVRDACDAMDAGRKEVTHG